MCWNCYVGKKQPGQTLAQAVTNLLPRAEANLNKTPTRAVVGSGMIEGIIQKVTIRGISVTEGPHLSPDSVLLISE